MMESLSKADLQQRYDEFAPDYDREIWIVDVLLGIRRHRRRLFGRAQGKVLDVATGTGMNLPYLPESVERVVAIDLSPEMLFRARNVGNELGLEAEYQVMDAEAMTFADDSFDTVISSLSTCTFPDPVATLREMARVCKPHGSILLLEHGRSSWSLMGWFQDRTARRHYAEVGCRWNQEPLDIARQAGLRVVESSRHLAGVFHAVIAQPPE